MNNILQKEATIMKIAIVCDSGSGFDLQTAKEDGIYFLPLQIIDEDKTYLDGYDTTISEIYELMRQGKMMKTSLPPLGLIEETFEEIKKEGYEHIIAVTLTAGLSATMQSVRLAANQTDIPITCIECYSAAQLQKYLAQSAKRLVDEGVSLEKIVARLNESVKHSNTIIIPDDLNHLKRGGRLTPIAAALGGMLKIKPVLKLDESTEGKIDTLAKVRTMSKAIQTAVDTFVSEGIDENYELVVLHAEAEQLAKEVEDVYFANFPNNSTTRGLIGPVIAVHTGLGCVGLQYIKKV